jgi:S-DNA-T family DNA segregation ATPase FtsK/SpoIIIE
VSDGGRVRVSVETWGELEVALGTTVGDLRQHLAGLGPRPDGSAGAVTVDGRPLDDAHPAGREPFVQGAHLVVGEGPPDPVAAALAAPWHAAVVAGPDAGRVAAPRAGGARLDVGRGGEATVGRLALTDPTVSRDHVAIQARPERRRPGRRRRGERWVLRELGSVNGTLVQRADGPLPAPPRRARPGRRAVRQGDRVLVGSSVLVVRSPGAIRCRCDPPAPDAAPESPSDDDGAPPLATWLLPVLASLVLAAAMRNAAFLVMVLAGPAGLLLPRLVRRRRRARAASAAASAPPSTYLSWDPAAISVHQASRRAGSEQAGVGACSAAAPWLDLARDGLALLGSDDAVLDLARTLVGGALLDSGLGLTLLHPPARAAAWAWARWLEARLGDLDAARVGRSPGGAEHVLAARRAGPLLVVADGAELWAEPIGAWWHTTRTPQDAVLVVGAERDAVPAWCRWLAEVAADGTVTLRSSRPEDVTPTRAHPAPLTPAWWLEAHARRIAAADHLDAARDADTSLPALVALADLAPSADSAAVRAAWATDEVPGEPGGRGLLATLGVGADGRPFQVDLMTDGPHVLVAGTTGSGKSELLQSLVLGLALRHPPSRVALVLVDYKGGASFGPCRDLPHVSGQVTDLDPGEATRALHGLRAELRRRERLLADAGVGDLEALRARAASRSDQPGRRAPDVPAVWDVPPRLVVVVDEFRALAEEEPDVVSGLVRIAAQGRSLGIHLVLATQRPAGAVTAQMRANVSLRICLRVTDAADSSDVVDVPDAASLPVDRPGRALVRRGPAAPEVVQTAWAARPATSHGGPGARHADPPAVQQARPWVSFAPDEQGDREDQGSPPPHAARERFGCADADETSRLVTVVTDAAREEGHLTRPVIWLPPLPAVVRPEQLRDMDPVQRDGLPLAMTDLPHAQARGVLTWQGRGVLLVVGAHGTGRTTSLRLAALEGLRRGWDVHAVSGPLGHGAGHGDDAGTPGRGQVWPSAPHPCLGTVCDGDDPRLVARLLAALLEAPSRPGDRTLLLLDDVGAVRRSLERLPRGAGSDLLDRTVREAHQRGLAVVASAGPADAVPLLPHAAERLVLAVDPHDDSLLGVPRVLAHRRRAPGSGVHLSGPAQGDGSSAQGAAGRAVLCQVALPPTEPSRGPSTALSRAPSTGRPTEAPTVAPDRAGRPAPVRLRAVPRAVSRTAAERPRDPRRRRRSGVQDPAQVLVGLGGDDARPVHADVGSGLLVVGPARSGRSEALTTLGLGLRAGRAEVVVVARDGPLAALGRLRPATHARTTAELEALLSRAARPIVGPSEPPTVLVDDLDLVCRTSPVAEELLCAWVLAAEAGATDVPRVVGSARTDRAVTAYRGTVAALRSAGALLLLSPAAQGSADLAGLDLSLHVDPADPWRPGAGVLVSRGAATCVQVAGPTGPADPLRTSS